MVIPDGVTTIGEYAFAWCTNLENILIPAGMTKIDVSVFYESGICHVLYKGTEEQWKTISGDSPVLRKARVHFNCTGEEMEPGEFWTCQLCCQHSCKEWSVDDTRHSGTCFLCGATVTGEHEHLGSEITQKATCQADGIKTYRCVCGHSYEEVIPKLSDHVYGDRHKDDTEHTKQCIYC